MSARRPVAALLAAALLAALPVIGVRAADDSGVAAVEDFGGCLAAGGQGRLLLLVDTSASLKESDPEDQRVEAADYLVGELASFVRRSGADLEVAVSGFADDWDRTLPWTSLTGSGAEKVAAAVRDFRDRDRGFETDYWTALTEARRYLSAGAGESACNALVWVSDGSYDLDKRDTAQERDAYGVTKAYGPDVDLVDAAAERSLERAGREDLCRPGGVADALRVDGITTVAIGLQGRLKASDFNLMKGVATGSPIDGAPCGRQAPRGAFVLTSDVPALFFAVDAFSDPDHPAIGTATPYCQGRICGEYPHEFVLDPSISTVRILGGSQLTRFFAVLIAPNGKQVRIEPTRAFGGDQGAFSLRGSWRADSVFSLVIDRKSDQGWTGLWKLVFVDPASTDSGTARSNIRLYGDLEPAWLDKDSELVSGERPELRFGLQRQDGTRVDPATIAGSIALKAQLLYPDGTSIPVERTLTAGDLESPVPLDLSEASPGSAKLRLSLVLTTSDAGAEPGTELEPQSVDYPVTVGTPPSYAKVPPTLDFGTGEDADPRTATLRVAGDGCVWLGDTESAALPEGVDRVGLSSKASSKATCTTGDLVVTLTPDAVGSGLVNGTLQVMSAPGAGPGPVLSVPVEYRYEMRLPARTAVLWAVFVALLLLGLLIPLLLLMAAKWWTAKIPGDSLAWLVVSGNVGGGSSFLNREIVDRSLKHTRSLHGRTAAGWS